MYPHDDFQDYHQPYGWWGYHWSPPAPLSVVQLIQAGSMDSSLAALLWLMLERRASLVVAAGPPMAGKTATLTALLDFLPPEVERIYLRGLAESFDFVSRVPPERAYLLCNEISPDLPTYMWGRKAAMVFQLMGQGYPMASTMHADSVEEVVSILEEALGVPRTLVPRLNLVLTLRVAWSGERISRWVNSLHLLRGDSAGELTSLPLAQRTSKELQHRPGEALVYLEASGLPRNSAEQELERRSSFLDDLVEKGVSSSPRVRAAIADYRPGSPDY
ncbi:MAG: hypothetical protein Q8P59_03335 [Dehalococcoidia bacterium]|nr:hypothetical protein [Dehalococcoidia bacterium]